MKQQTKDQHQKPTMTKYSSSDINVLSEGIEYDSDDADTNISKLSKEMHSFPGAQYFDEIMHEKTLHKNIAPIVIADNIAELPAVVLLLQSGGLLPSPVL